MKNNEVRIAPWEYVIIEDKKVVLYAVKAHDKLFVGKAKCGPHDEFDVEAGKAIAKMRAVLAQRRYDLMLTREFINTIKEVKSYAEFTNRGVSSPHYMRSIQAACEEEKAQLAHIKDLVKRLEAYNAAPVDEDFQVDDLL